MPFETHNEIEQHSTYSKRTKHVLQNRIGLQFEAMLPGRRL